MWLHLTHFYHLFIDVIFPSYFSYTCFHTCYFFQCFFLQKYNLYRFFKNEKWWYNLITNLYIWRKMIGINVETGRKRKIEPPKLLRSCTMRTQFGLKMKSIALARFWRLQSESSHLLLIWLRSFWRIFLGRNIVSCTNFYHLFSFCPFLPPIVSAHSVKWMASKLQNEIVWAIYFERLW